jgi:hypothetical protein
MFISANFLQAENILKILEGYGRDSVATFSARSGQSEAAKLFNLILESDGKVTADKAEEYLNSAKTDVIRSYLAVMLADYSFVNNGYDSGLRYLKRAVDEYDPIRNDSYYRTVLSRAQKDIKESPGKTEPHKTSVLSKYTPATIKEEPPVAVSKPAEPDPAKTTVALPATDQSPSPDIKEDTSPNFRIQVGAFSVLDNVEKKKKFYEDHGYSVQIDKRQRTDGYLYLIRIGAYDTYDQAKNALNDLKTKYPSEEGIVIKVEK